MKAPWLTKGITHHPLIATALAGFATSDGGSEGIDQFENGNSLQG
jgi:hypothetical protein